MSVLKSQARKLGVKLGRTGGAMSTTSRKWVVGLVSGSVIVGGAAFAYWTATGAGSDTADTGTTESIVINQTSSITGLAPGVAAQTLSGNFDNPNDSSVYVGSVSVTVSGTDTVGCGADDYTIGGSAPVNAQVASGDGVGSWSGLTIQFNNKAGVNQNACKGAVVNLSYTSN